MARVPAHMKKVMISINVGDNRDCMAEDFGPGIQNMNKFTTERGHAKDEEFERRRRDPEFIGLFGWGVVSSLGLSEEGRVEFHNSSMVRGNITKSMTTLRYDKDEGDGYEPIEAYALIDHLGLKIIVKRLKGEFTKKLIMEFLAETFARKFPEYKIFVRDALTDGEEFSLVERPETFCSAHEVQIGVLSNGYPVFVDLHRAENVEESKVDILVKKVKMDIYQSDHLIKGYIWSDGLEFGADRAKILTDEEYLFPEMKRLVENFCEQQGFEKRVKSADNRVKNEKRIKERALDFLKKYRKLNPNEIVPSLRGVPTPNEEDNATEEQFEGWLNKNKKKKKKEKETESDLEKVIQEITKATSRNQHRKRKRIQKIISDDNNAEPDLDIKRSSEPGKEKPMIFINLASSTLLINTAHECSNLLSDERHNLKLWDTMIAWAVVDCQPENKNISHEAFGRKYWDLLNAGI